MGLYKSIRDRGNNMSEGLSHLAEPLDMNNVSTFRDGVSGQCFIANHWSSTNQAFWGSPSPHDQAYFTIQCVGMDGGELLNVIINASWIFKNSLSLTINYLYCDFYGIRYTVLSKIPLCCIWQQGHLCT